MGSFQGLWTDPITGLSYARARWYDARNASWLSEDPLQDVDSPNLYAFVQWQPNSQVDPLGLQTGDEVTYYFQPGQLDYDRELVRCMATDTVPTLLRDVREGVKGGLAIAKMIAEEGSLIASFKLGLSMAQGLRNAPRALEEFGAAGPCAAGGKMGSMILEAAAGGGVTLAAEKYITRFLKLAPEVPDSPNVSDVGNADRLALPSGNPASRTDSQVARLRGSGYERGAAFNQHLHELHGGSREVPVSTRLGGRRHDVGDVALPTGARMGIEGKNYLAWRTVGGQAVEGAVRITPEIQEQLLKDVLWLREGRKLGEERIMQWHFGGAGPDPELRRQLMKWGINIVEPGG